MADTFDPATRSDIMRKVLSKNTSPELAVRRALHAAGFRYRLHRKDLPGKPDLVLPRYKLVVQVHGCFWHGHPCKRGARMPATNREYWERKIGRNVSRDQAAREELERQGWRLRVLWECELRAGVEALLRELEAERETGDAQPSP